MRYCRRPAPCGASTPQLTRRARFQREHMAHFALCDDSPVDRPCWRSCLIRPGHAASLPLMCETVPVNCGTTIEVLTTRGSRFQREHMARVVLCDDRPVDRPCWRSCLVRPGHAASLPLMWEMPPVDCGTTIEVLTTWKKSLVERLFEILVMLADV